MAGVSALLLLGGLAGCAASTPPPRELVSARTSYDRARKAGAPSLAPLGLRDARAALERAERAFDRDARSLETRTWAYVADRKARQAEAMAGIAAAERQRVRAVQAFQDAQAALRRKAEAELASVSAELDQTKRKLVAQEAELRAHEQALKDRQHALDEARAARRMDEADLGMAREQIAAQRAEIDARKRELDRAEQARKEAEQRAQQALDALMHSAGSESGQGPCDVRGRPSEQPEHPAQAPSEDQGR